jgi:tetratricopeptide (TPR) repeat protein
MKTSITDIQLVEHWLQNGDLQRAKALLIELSQSKITQAYASKLLSQVLAYEGNLDGAIQLLQNLSNTPDHAQEALLSLGNLYLESGNQRAAINSYKLALEKSETCFEALHNLGLAHAQLFEYAEASHFFGEACSMNPNSFEAQINYGSCLKNLGLYKQSLEHLCQAEKINLNDARVRLNKGVTLESMGHFIDAVECYEAAIKLRPNYLEAHTNKGNAFLLLGRHLEAEKAYNTALTINPSDPDAHYNLALLQLTQGNYAQGWKNYEYRWLRENAPKKSFPTLPELKSLNEISGKKLLIWGEQGLGDTLQFSRYVSTLKNLGAHITLACPKPLLEILKDVDGVERIISLDDEPPGGCDSQAALMSIPFLLSKSRIQATEIQPYIKSDPIKRIVWSKKLEGEKKLKVGLVWNGGFHPGKTDSWPANSRRNIPFPLMAKLQHISGIQFYSLQKGEPAETELNLQHSTIWPANNLTILGEQLKDFSDTAALIDHLDLVISVDTSTVHLAGALGKPVWILNRFDSCWRWLIKQEKTHWYPSARIFNQPSPGDWNTVIDAVIKELQALASAPKNKQSY